MPLSANPANRRVNPFWAWSWFAYTGFLFIEPVVEPSVRRWIIAVSSLLVFAVIFYAYERNDGRNKRVSSLLIAATFVLGLLVFPDNPGGMTFFIYTAGFLPFHIRSARVVMLCFALEAVCILAEARFLHASYINGAIAIFLLLMIGAGNLGFAAQKRSDSKLRMANEEIEALAAVAERERIARDLHDVLGHTLSVIVLKAELAGRLLDTQNEDATQRARTELADVERTARTALAEVREAIGGYRSKGLAAEIEAAGKTLAAAGVTMHAEALDAKSSTLSAQEETVLSLALREAVTNIVRHAKARNCTLRFGLENGRRRLIVEDDGQNSGAQEGNGLRGMRERVEALGGNVDLSREQGTRLRIDLPITSQGATQSTAS